MKSLHAFPAQSKQQSPLPPTLQHTPSQRLALLLPICAALFLSACSQGQNGTAGWQPPPTKVDVLTVKAAAFTVMSELPGRIAPVRTAEVRARVAGIILKRNFQEGSQVKAGELLFQIDPAPFQAALVRAEAQLAQAEAQLENAESTLKRHDELIAMKAVSRQEYDTARAELKSAAAARRMAQAEVTSRRLDLGYASVRAPISGRIGRALVTEGALVGQNEATPLALIQQLDPVYADFQQPAAQALQLRSRLQGQPKAANALTLKVEGNESTHQGQLLFSDVSVDPGTGQILLRGRFGNADGLLLPGMYVRVAIPAQTVAQAYQIPQRAVSHLPDGTAQVMVVNAENTVEARTVKTVAMQGASWIIHEGLQDGDRVVVNVATPLHPGAQVEISAPAAADTNGAAK